MSKKSEGLIVRAPAFAADGKNDSMRLSPGTVASRAGGPGICEMCGEPHELKPAGPASELVCLACARKAPEALRAFARRWAFG